MIFSFFRRVCLTILFTAFSITLFTALPVFAESTYIFDTPTKGILDYGTYNIDFRFFSGGGILSRMSFGIFRIVNLGVGWEVENVVGTETPIAAPPSLYLKIKPFSGGMVLPGFAFGYDGQGYFYNKDSNEFAQKEKGIFIVFGREILAPGLNFNFGCNMNDFKSNKLFGFTSLEYEIEEKFMILAEYDNINYLPDARLNAGFRLFIAEDISVDIAGRDLNTSDRKAERIVKIGYTGRF